MLCIYTCHANGTSDLCGKDVGTATCSISSCLIILIRPKDSPGVNEVCWGNFGCQRKAYSPSAGLRGWCWAACTRHPPSSHREWMKAAHDGTSARAHCSLQRQAMAAKVSVVRNVFWRWGNDFTGDVSSCKSHSCFQMLKNAQTLTMLALRIAHPYCSNLWRTTGQHTASTLGLGRFPQRVK